MRMMVVVVHAKRKAHGLRVKDKIRRADVRLQLNSGLDP